MTLLPLSRLSARSEPAVAATAAGPSLTAEQQESILDRLQTDSSSLRNQLITHRAGVDELRHSTSGHDFVDDVVSQTTADLEVSTASRSWQRLHNTEAAIERVLAGTYGQCTECGEPISFERLDALPLAICCVTCAA